MPGEWSDAASVLGGVGLFLLGMRLITDGLRLAAGTKLTRILEYSTATPLRGVLTGVLITAFVQSSSAVTVATIGFANAGLLGLRESILIVYGSNVGTTVTGWWVALVGFSVDVKAFALPLVGIGMALRVISPRTRWGALGEAFAGFGIFFFGIGILRDGFEIVGRGFALEVGIGPPYAAIPLAVASGFLLTVIMQSSSAAIAIILTAAAGTLVPIATAAAAVVGANIGTTATAALSAIGATPNAKRVAGAHLAFNFLTGLVALAILPVLLATLTRIQPMLGMDRDIPALLAGFHTLFNLLGLLLMLPLTGYLVRFLQHRFRSAEEDEARPQYLDRNVVGTPIIALQALQRETGRIANVAFRMAADALSIEVPAPVRLDADHRTLNALVDAVGSFVSEVQRANLSSEVAERLGHVLRVSGYYASMADLSLQVARNASIRLHVPDAELAADVAGYKREIVSLFDSALPGSTSFSAPEASARFARIAELYEPLKSRVLRAGVTGTLRTGHLVGLLEMMRDARELALLAEKAAGYVARLDSVDAAEPAAAAGSASAPGDANHVVRSEHSP